MDFLILTQTSHLWLFSLMVFGIIVLPGMDMAYVMASSMAGGRQSGLAALLGILLGGVVHVVMAAFGVGLLLKLYPVAFNALLMAGSIYIAWIGWSLWRGAAALGEVDTVPRVALVQSFWRGMLTCLMNPKAYIFMVAVFPQFVRPEYGSLVAQSVVMSLIIATIQFAVYGAMAWGAGGLQVWLRGNPGSQVMMGRTVGLLLILAAVWTGWQGLQLVN